MKIHENNKQTRNFLIGCVGLSVLTDIPLQISEGMEAFQSVAAQTVIADVIYCANFPEVEKGFCGSDKLFCYYRSKKLFYQKAISGTGGSISEAVYSSDFSYITLYINEATFPNVVRTADKILQLLPMKQMLAYFGAFLLHSSRISVAGKAVLFTAPSQTGKTTQARLWQEHAGAKIAGNDRTLLWTQEEQVMTGGYPVDGSSPVYSSEQIPLGAVVVLRQSPENRVQRLPASLALRFLMEQTALDAWNSEEYAAAQNFWLKLLERYPVYMLSCRPDEGAVQSLKSQLIRDEVISDGFHTQ